jgi:hypothetical protein
MGLVVLNFSHPVTAEQQAEIERLGRLPVERVIEVSVRLDHEAPFAPQVVALAEAAGLSPKEWQTLPLVVNLPSLALAAGGLLVELHGRIGHFPTVLHLRPETSGPTTVFVVAALENLQALRDAARTRRQPTSKEAP